jgi:transcriptional regulator GlxA family with amidase domain
MTCRISVIAFDDCFASTVVGSQDLFFSANVIAGNMIAANVFASNVFASKLDPTRVSVFDPQIVSIEGRTVRSISGYRIEPSASLEQAQPAQLVIVPVIAVTDPDVLAATLERLRPVSEWLKLQYALGSWIAATSTGTFLLAEAGLLHGRRAATTTWFTQFFEQRYPQTRLEDSGQIVTVDRIISCGGTLSYVDLALHLIEQFANRELARACARYLVMDNRRDTQAPDLIRHHACTYDPLITKADRFMRANLRRDIRIQDVAEHVSVSIRTLMRRFKESTGASPQEYLQKLRLEAGKALLANSRLNLEQILDRIGYHDDSAFRRLFRRHTNLSPREYRQRFGRAP